MGPPQSYFDGKSREELEHLAATRRREDIGKKAQIALDKLNAREGDQSAERRHRESIAVDRSARNIGWAAFGVAVVALGVSVFALPQVQTLISQRETPRLLPDSGVSHPGVSPPASLPHPSKDDISRPPTPPIPTKESTPPSKAPTPKVPPIPPTQ